MNAITPEELDNWFTYHAPQHGDNEKYEEIRKAGKELARLIVSYAPPCADTTYAVRQVRMATMTANAAIACGGK
jgi:hypothetical protein